MIPCFFKDFRVDQSLIFSDEVNTITLPPLQNEQGTQENNDNSGLQNTVHCTVQNIVY